MPMIFLRIDNRIGVTDFGQRVVDRDRIDTGGRRKQDYVGHFRQALGVIIVYLYKDPVGILEVSGRGPDGGGEIDSAVPGHIGRLYDRIIELSEKPGQQGLWSMRQVHVDVLHLLAG